MGTIKLTPEQQNAYDLIGEHKKLFLSGPAGCGKSVIITEKIKHDTSGDFILCATTNKAASVLSEKLDTGVKVSTLHSVLGLKPVNDGSTKDSDEITDFIFPTTAKNQISLVGKHLIVDEASMICLKMQTYILEMLEFGNLSSVTFVGDRYQLSCVKGDFFDYDLIDEVVELKQVKRAKGALLDYYNEVREKVILNESPDLFEDSKVFDSKKEFVEYMKNCTGSKVIITYTNEASKNYSHLIDSSTFYEGQECNALSPCRYKHYDLTKYMTIATNFPVKIVKLFKNYGQMERESIRDDYEFHLPNKPIEIEIENISYAKVLNEDGEIVYISIWNGTKDEKDKLYLNNFTREYRLFQDSVKLSIPSFAWHHYAKSDGYLKNLSLLKGKIKLPKHIESANRKFWNNFHVVADAVILRSRLVSTAHRAQGTTVDTVGIDIDDLSKSGDAKLAYVALTRASKELVFYITKGNNDEE